MSTPPTTTPVFVLPKNLPSTERIAKIFGWELKDDEKEKAKKTVIEKSENAGKKEEELKDEIQKATKTALEGKVQGKVQEYFGTTLKTFVEDTKKESVSVGSDDKKAESLIKHYDLLQDLSKEIKNTTKVNFDDQASVKQKTDSVLMGLLGVKTEEEIKKKLKAAGMDGKIKDVRNFIKMRLLLNLTAEQELEKLYQYQSGAKHAEFENHLQMMNAQEEHYRDIAKKGKFDIANVVRGGGVLGKRELAEFKNQKNVSKVPGHEDLFVTTDKEGKAFYIMGTITPKNYNGIIEKLSDKKQITWYNIPERKKSEIEIECLRKGKGVIFSGGPEMKSNVFARVPVVFEMAFLAELLLRPALNWSIIKGVVAGTFTGEGIDLIKRKETILSATMDKQDPANFAKWLDNIEKNKEKLMGRVFSTPDSVKKKLVQKVVGNDEKRLYDFWENLKKEWGSTDVTPKNEDDKKKRDKLLDTYNHLMTDKQRETLQKIYGNKMLKEIETIKDKKIDPIEKKAHEKILKGLQEKFTDIVSLGIEGGSRFKDKVKRGLKGEIKDFKERYDKKVKDFKKILGDVKGGGSPNEVKKEMENVINKIEARIKFDNKGNLDKFEEMQKKPEKETVDIEMNDKPKI